MKLGRTITLASVVMGVTALASPGCGSSGLVGGDCADGLTNCSNRCIDLQIDQYNCGSCGHMCLSGVACIHGKCGGVDEVGGAGYGGSGGAGGHFQDGSIDGSDASSDAKGDQIIEFDVNYPQGGNTSAGGSGSGGDGSGGAATGGDNAGGAAAGGDNAGGAATGGTNTGGTATGGNSTGGTSATGGTGEPDANPCVPPFNDPQHCGDCTTVCVDPNPVCAPSSGSYECRPLCDAPLVNCNGSCADLNSDSNNCGGCGIVCPSTICQGGACVGVQSGDFVAICMNYRTPSSGPTAALLGSSLMPHSNPVRVFAYDEYADAASRQQVDATLSSAVSSMGLQANITHVSVSADVPQRLRKSDFDVFLVYEQPNAPTGELSRIGDLWASSLESYTYVGGVIVMLDGGQGVREMPQLFTSTRMFQASSEVILVPPPVLAVPPSTDIVRHGLTNYIPSQADTCVFETTVTPNSTSTTFVVAENVESGMARPVVVHMTRTAPQP